MRVGLLAAGNLSRDKIHTPAGYAERLAGSSFYAAMVAARLGSSAGVLAKAGRDVREEELRPLRAEGIDLSGLIIDDGETASYELYYTGEDRELFLRSPCRRITPEEVISRLDGAEAALVSPIYDEVPADTFREIVKRVGLLGLDPQGYIRRAGEGGHISFSDWEDSEEFLGMTSVLFTSRPEIRYLTGDRGSDVASMLMDLWDMGPEVVLMTREGGASSSLLVWEGRITEIPVIPPERVVDPGGAGDSSAAAFLVEFVRTGDAVWSALFASATSSFIYEAFGAEGAPRRADVLSRLKDYLERVGPGSADLSGGMLDDAVG